MEKLKVDNIMQVLSFKLGEEEYGTDISNISTIIENNLPITRVPGTPDFIKGVVNLRGDIVPIMELRQKLNLPTVEDTEDTKIIVVNINEMIVGIKVDRVIEVLQIDKEFIGEASDMGKGKSGEYFTGLFKFKERIIVLMNAEKLIKS